MTLLLPPPIPDYTLPTTPPDRLDHGEKSRIRLAAYQAGQRYPGCVGELLSRELLAAEAFGYRLGGQHIIDRLVDHLLGGTP